MCILRTYLSVKDICQLYSKLSDQTSSNGSAVMDDLQQISNQHATVIIITAIILRELLMQLFVTFKMSLLSRIIARPFLKARAPSNRTSNRYTLFLVAI